MNEYQRGYQDGYYKAIQEVLEILEAYNLLASIRTMIRLIRKHFNVPA